ncbi:MAG: hypothetical protein FWG45_04080 [Oscillospiraceae bacterium]|nr:hypothetical protein [Oscillospiraceae bacterium]
MQNPKNVKQSAAMAVWGWILAILGFGWTFMAVSFAANVSIMEFEEDVNEKGMTIMILGFGVLALAGGITLIVTHYKRKRALARYAVYWNIIFNNRTNSINEIAAITGINYETVLKDLQYMVSHQHIANAYVDIQNRIIVIN